MKIMFSDNISAISADEESANFPIENVQNDIVRQVWRATSADSIVTLTVESDSDTVSVFGTNAGTITVTIKNVAETVTLFGPTDYDLRGIDTLFKFMTDTAESHTSIWAEYDTQGVQHKIILEFDGSSGIIVEAGIIRAGEASNYNNPDYGLSNSYLDYSVVKELNNGSTWIDRKNIVQTFNGGFTILRDTDFPVFMKQFRDNIGVSPLPWLVLDVSQNNIYSLFARCNLIPSGNHNYVEESVINFELEEQV